VHERIQRARSTDSTRSLIRANMSSDVDEEAYDVLTLLNNNDNNDVRSVCIVFEQ
jgi:hypothetical protein